MTKTDMMAGTVPRESIQSIAARQGFTQMTAGSGVFKVSIFIRNKGENHPNSMDVLEKAHLDPFTYQEILLLLQSHDLFKQELKGKWFWLKGKGLAKELSLYTIDAKGELVEITVDTPLEKTVRVWNGTNPLSLDVSSGDEAADYGRRYDLTALNAPHHAAPFVVGKAKPEQNAQQGSAEKTGRLLRVEENHKFL
jgi:hypothetical protein